MRGRPRLERFPFGPISRVAGTSSPYRVARRAGVAVGGQLAAEWPAQGLTMHMADRVAVGLGHHPAEVWSEWNQTDGDDDDG